MAAYITPPSGWIDLVPLSIGVQADGHHSYVPGVDISVGPMVGVPQVVESHVDGLSGNTSGAGSTTAMIQSMACSSALVPKLEFIYQARDAFSIGWANQCQMTDDASGNSFRDGMYSIYFASGYDVLIIRHRLTATINAGASGVLVGDWLRLTIENTPQSQLTIHKLVSGNPIDWDGGALLFSYSDTALDLIGGSVLVPFWTGDGTNQRIRAVKVTPRRIL